MDSRKRVWEKYTKTKLINSYKQQEDVEVHDPLHPEGTRRMKQAYHEAIIKQKNC